MKLKLTIPGKCFLLGEYLALNQGPALVFASLPAFSLIANDHKISSAGGTGNPFNPFSPAGRFYTANEDVFSRFSLGWFDPHFGAGGWGASSAQFLALHYLLQLASGFGVEGEIYPDLHDLLLDYQSFAKTDGAMPSGADLIAQATGGITYFERRSGKVQRFAWPFSDIGLAFVATGKKLATHEHLATIAGLSTDRFEFSVHESVEALRTVNSARFVDGLGFFATELANAGLVAETTKDLLLELGKIPGVLAAKGCGAMGVDTILLLYSRQDRGLQVLQENLLNFGLKLIATEENISPGIGIEFSGVNHTPQEAQKNPPQMEPQSHPTSKAQEALP